MPFFTPIAASSCARTVLGIRTSRTPRWAIAAPYPTASSIAPPPMATTKLFRQMRRACTSSRTHLAVSSSSFADSQTESRRGDQPGVDAPAPAANA